MQTNKLSIALAGALSLITGTGWAADVSIHGFGTAGAAMGNSSTPYLGHIDDKVSFENDTRIGLQVSAHVADDVDFTAQLLSRGSTNDSYAVKADWAYISYKVNDNASVRAGRVIMPLLLVSDYVQVGYAYPWIRPPEEVYAYVPLTALSGIDVPYTFKAQGLDFTVQPYGGSFRDTTTSRGLDVKNDANNMLGANVAVSNEMMTLRAGYLQTNLSLSINPAIAAMLPPGADISMDKEKIRIWTVGGKMDWHNIVGYTEYAKFNMAANLPDTSAWYATIGYRMNSWLPHVTFAKITSADNVPLSQDQQSVTLGLRHELTTSSALKFEVKHVRTLNGTFGLYQPEIDSTTGRPQFDKSNANIYSIAYDVVF